MPSPDRVTRIGIVSALQEEQSSLMTAMRNATVVTAGMRRYVCGQLWEMDCVCVLSRIGKVAAAATIATLIERFHITHLLFTGVAGSVTSAVKVGDLVIADRLVQHDMNAFPLFPRFEIPLLKQTCFASDARLTTLLMRAGEDFLRDDMQHLVGNEDRELFGLHQPRLHRGLIASGDEFIHGNDRRAALKQALPDALAVEMEGAAVAQVCFEFGIPFAVVRTISDDANDHAPRDFMRFLERVAAKYAHGIVQRMMALPITTAQ